MDIYALAASFYYAVTGQKPTPSMERRLDNRPLKSPKEINPNLSEHLNKAITLGMSLEKGDRPQSMSDWLQQLELPPPAVEPQYRQEKVNPPRSVKPEKEPEVVQKKPKVNQISAQNSIQKKLKNLPWGWLVGVFLVYGLVGYSLGVNLAPWPVVAVAGVVAGVVAVAWAVAVAVAVAWAVAVAVAWAVAWAGAGTWAWTWTWAVAVAVAWLWKETSIFDRWKHQEWIGFFLFCVFPGLVGGITFSLMSGNIIGGIVTGIGSIVIFFVQLFAASKLNDKKISPINIFLILTVTNLSGLGSGWFLGLLVMSPKG